AVAEGAPAAQGRDDYLAAAGRIRDPLAPVLREQVFTLVAHDLQALDVGVDIEDAHHLVDHVLPVDLEHAPGSIDDEDDVLAVHGDAAHVIGALDTALREEPFHFVRQLLQCRLQFPLDYSTYRRVVADAGIGLSQPFQFRLQPRHPVAPDRQLLVLGV